MLADSGLLRDLEAYAFSPAGLPMCIYGDPAYPLRVHLQGPFRNPHLTPLMKWLFGDVINYFKLLDFKKNVKIGMRSISKIYSLSTAAQCPHQLYGNKTYRFSSLNPPPSRNTLVRGRKK